MYRQTNRSKLLGAEWSCSCGAWHNVPVRAVVIEKDALHRLPDLAKNEIKSGTVVVISDLITRKIAAKRAAEILAGSGFCVRELIIPHEKPVVDDKTADWVSSKIRNESLLISCGSGTVTDLTKNAAFIKGRPFIAVATAPSMNGYASGIVALTENGLKKTVVSAPPVAVICDLNILCDAPLEMICAGLGDVISKPVAMADWKLSSIVKKEHFCTLPFELIADLEPLYTKEPSLISKRDPKTIGALTEALVYSGISMIIAGSSAPASGAEHLISHTLDMQSAVKGVKHDLHGAQVGVATLVTAKLYEEIVAFDPDRLDWTKIWEYHKVDRTNQIVEYWGPLAPQVMHEFAKKQIPQKKNELGWIVDNWDDIVDELQPFLIPHSEIKRILTGALAKAHYSDIGAGPEEFRKAIMMARTMRSRYTILDLADDLNLLEGFAQKIVQEQK